MFDMALYIKLVYSLNVLQGEGCTVAQIVDYINTDLSKGDLLHLRDGYHKGITADMGDTVIVACNIFFTMDKAFVEKMCQEARASIAK